MAIYMLESNWFNSKAPSMWAVIRSEVASCLIASILAIGIATNCQAVDAVIVRPASWKAAAQPWLQHRAAQGMSIAEVDAGIGQQGIVSAIARLYAQSPDRLRFVLLASDVGRQPTVNIPTFYRNSTAMVQFGGDPVIATDFPYGDVDGDGIPDLAIGRIPADSASQLEKALSRVIRYENNQDFSNWRRDVHVVAGIGGFGVLADSMIEMTTRRFLADRIPGWSKVSMTHASIGSHYCPDPWRFSETCIGRFNQGSMFWVYIGHGHVRTLDYFKAKQEFLPILTSQHVPAIATGNHPPIAVFLACYTGAFDAPEDSLAEELVLHDNGPIAAIAASRVSGPYGLASFSDGLLRNCFELEQPTLGEIVLATKRGLLAAPDPKAASVSTKSSNNQMKMIDAIATAMSPQDYDLSAERAEHVWQMQLLGDPMLRPSYPSTLELVVPKRAAAGDTISVTGTIARAAHLTLEFAHLREKVRRELNGIVDLDTQSGRDQLQKRYEAANDGLIETNQLNLKPGPFVINVKIPSDLPHGRYCLRAFGQGATGWHAGYAEIRVPPPHLDSPSN